MNKLVTSFIIQLQTFQEIINEYYQKQHFINLYDNTNNQNEIPIIRLRNQETYYDNLSECYQFLSSVILSTKQIRMKFENFFTKLLNEVEKYEMKQDEMGKQLNILLDEIETLEGMEKSEIFSEQYVEMNFKQYMIDIEMMKQQRNEHYERIEMFQLNELNNSKNFKGLKISDKMNKLEKSKDDKKKKEDEKKRKEKHKEEKKKKDLSKSWRIEREKKQKEEEQRKAEEERKKKEKMRIWKEEQEKQKKEKEKEKGEKTKKDKKKMKDIKESKEMKEINEEENVPFNPNDYIPGKQNVHIVLAGLNKTGKTTVAKSLCGIEITNEYDKTTKEMEYHFIHNINKTAYTIEFHDRNGFDFETTKCHSKIVEFLKKGRIQLYFADANDDGSIDLLKGYFKSIGYNISSAYYQIIILTHIDCVEDTSKALKTIQSFTQNIPIWEVNALDEYQMENIKQKLFDLLLKAHEEHFDMFENCEAMKK